MEKINCLDNNNFNTMEEFVKNGYQLIQEGNKSIHALPSGASKKLYTACPAFTNVLNTHSDRILSIMGQIIKLQNVKGNIQRRDNDEKFELLQEANDILFERINSNLDEMAGIRNTMVTPQIETETDHHESTSITIGTINQKTTPTSTTTPQTNESWNRQTQQQHRSRTLANLIAGKTIQRSQLNFKIPIDNRSDVPFEPRIKYKPNSIKPLAILPEYNPDDGQTIENYLHPYEFELNKFQPNKWQLEKCVEPQEANPIDGLQNLQYIDTVQQLDGLLMDLSKVDVKEIAVDLEHHSYRTFQGFTCLLQISTRTTDYIIDTLTLRDDLHVLNEIFTDPNKVKVFHGAACDIEWLQRDLSIYVVNLFDTHQAAKRLNFPRLSLAYLLKYYCNLDVDKTFQMADWRIRPLPKELLFYARQDTHYLLYIYDRLTNELLDRANTNTNLLLNVYQNSTDVCKIRYQKPKLMATSHLEMYSKSKRSFDNRQLYALHELYLWRDRLARHEDESLGYVLPNHMLLQIAENLPREMQGILACCNPIPALVRQQLTVIHQIILKARSQSIIKPIIITDEFQTSRLDQSLKIKDFCSALYCPHDLSNNQEFRDDLPTLLNGDDDIGKLIQNDFESSTDNCKLKIVKQSKLKVFDDDDDDLDNEMEEEQQQQKKRSSTSQDNQLKNIEIKFISPYSRYLAVLPFIEQQQKDELARKQQLDKLKKLCPDSETDLSIAIDNQQNKLTNNNGNDETADKLNIDLSTVPLIEYGKRKREWLLTKQQQSNANDKDHDLDEPKIKKQFIKTDANDHDNDDDDDDENDDEDEQKIDIKDSDSDACIPDDKKPIIDTNLIQMYVKRATKELIKQNQRQSLLKQGIIIKKSKQKLSGKIKPEKKEEPSSESQSLPPSSSSSSSPPQPSANQLRRHRKRNSRNNNIQYMMEKLSANIQSSQKSLKKKKKKAAALAAAAAAAARLSNQSSTSTTIVTTSSSTSTSSTPFDYKNVNFNKFKGGGSSNQQQQKGKSSKGKLLGSKKQLQKLSGKKVNKLFSNSSNNKSVKQKSGRCSSSMMMGNKQKK